MESDAWAIHRKANQLVSNFEPLPFPFGYNWRKEGKAFVMVARREPAVSSAP